MADATTCRPMDAATYKQHITDLVRNAPAPTAEQIATLRAVFGGAR